MHGCALFCGVPFETPPKKPYIFTQDSCSEETKDRNSICQPSSKSFIVLLMSRRNT